MGESIYYLFEIAVFSVMGIFTFVKPTETARKLFKKDNPQSLISVKMIGALLLANALVNLVKFLLFLRS